MTRAGCGQSVRGWLHCLWRGGVGGEASAPVPLRLRGQAQFGRRSFYSSHTRASAHTHAPTESERRRTGNMSSSYNLDFLPDMMVESRLLVPGDRM